MAVTGVMAAASCGWIALPTAAEPALLSLPAPPRDGGPVVVRAAFDLRDINEIDDEAETFEFEGVLILEWRDERQAFDPAAEGVTEKLYQGDYQFNEVFTGWFPQVVLVNESGLYEKHGVLLRVRPDGSLRLVETLDAAAETDLDLRAYPFDRQKLEAIFEVLGFDESEVVLQPSEGGRRVCRLRCRGGTDAAVEPRAGRHLDAESSRVPRRRAGGGLDLRREHRRGAEVPLHGPPGHRPYGLDRDALVVRLLDGPVVVG